MKFNEQKGNLFELDNNKYFYAHCISADYELGAGIAVAFQKKFHLKQDLKKIGRGDYPELIIINNVLNLVTKKNYWNKPTYESITKCIQDMRDFFKNTKLYKFLTKPIFKNKEDK